MVKAIFWGISFNLLFYLFFIPALMLFTHVSFRSIENEDVKKKLQQGRDIIQNDIDEISSITSYYANWDDMYEYDKNHGTHTLEDIFPDYELLNLDIDFIAILNTDGEIIATKVIGDRGNKITPTHFDGASLLKKYPELVTKNDNNGGDLKGIVLLDGKILLVSSRPIFTSQFQDRSFQKPMKIAKNT